jgi:AraC-like DNA-binding protein
VLLGEWRAGPARDITLGSPAGTLLIQKCAILVGPRPRLDRVRVADNGPVTSPSEDINRRLLRARNAMDRHYADPLDLDHLAGIAIMARSHFVREFRRVFGETPYRYLQRRRVERAMFMLRYGADSVTDICMSVGFASLGTFSRTFSSIVGQSPSEYRAEGPETAAAPTSFIMRWTRPTEPRR